jgi:single-stranded DNA-specific DHH superfamily exonuclease
MNNEVVTEYLELAEAQDSFEQFIAKIGETGTVVILCDGDVDGLGAATVLWYYLTRHGFSEQRLRVLQPGKGENAFTPATCEAVAALKPAAIFTLDLGIRDQEIVPGVPTLFVDHHRPEGEPPNSTVLTGYQWRPVPTSSLLTFLLCNRNAKVADKAWVAAIGNLGDLGPEQAEMQAAIREQKQKWLREATTLLNAAKRSSRPVEGCAAAFLALRDASSARALVESESDEVKLLRELKQEVQSELEKAKRTAPKFSKTEKVALLRFDSPARVHPLLAQSWRGRLKDFVVIAANGGYLPGKVSFSIRTNVEMNLLDFLREKSPGLEEDEAEYGHGHDKATGGVISNANWQRLATALGFEQ